MARNARLRELLDEAGCSNAQLARWVNDLGRERRPESRLTYGKTSVARWLGGSEPHWPTPSLVAEVLTRRLGYDVGIADLGWHDRALPRAAVADGLGLERSGILQLRTAADLVAKDLERRTFLRGVAFVAGAFAGPALVATTVPAPSGVSGAGVRAVSMADVDAVRATVSHYRGLDQQYGGAGALRSQVVRYLQGEISSTLDGTFSPSVGRQLFAAVAELVRLAGYMTFDAGRHALAQRYFVQSLGLAHAADDHVEVALTLACMSFQSVHLRDGREAVALARAATRSGRELPPLSRSMLASIEARGLALLGEERACTAALGVAERELRSASSPGVGWLRYFDEAELAHHAAHCMRDLGHPRRSGDLAEAALRGYPETSTRSRGFAHTVRATALLVAGEVEAACEEGGRALDAARRVRSARSLDWLRDFEVRLRPYGRQSSARELLDRARPVLAGAPS